MMNSNRDKIVQEFCNLICKVSRYLNCTSVQLADPVFHNNWSPKQLLVYLTSRDRFVLKKRIPHMMKGMDFPECSDFERFHQSVSNALGNQFIEEPFRYFILIRKMFIRQIQHIPEFEWSRKLSFESFEFTFQEYFEHMLKQEQPYFIAIDEILFEKN